MEALNLSESSNREGKVQASSPLYSYLCSLKEMPRLEPYKTLLHSIRQFSLEQAKEHALTKHSAFSKQSWSPESKFIMVCLVVSHCKFLNIEIMNQKMDPQIWKFVADTLGVKKQTTVIKKWLVVLRSNYKIQFNPRQEEILRRQCESLQERDWIRITLKIYQQAGTHFLRSQKSTRTRWNQLNPTKKEAYSVLQNSLMFAFVRNNRQISKRVFNEKELIDNRSNSALNNQKVRLSKRQSPTTQEAGLIMQIGMILYRMSMQCPQVTPTRSITTNQNSGTSTQEQPKSGSAECLQERNATCLFDIPHDESLMFQ